MDCIKTCCANVWYDYRANIIDYEEFKERLKIVDKEFKTKQLNLTLNKKEVEK
ncbi:hypothetical protein KAR91_05665 [Candidatus Pacearchaeota archaeon]|nr:hypothetical protein [Candidatus Pacearchaeota archaeon]